MRRRNLESSSNNEIYDVIEARIGITGEASGTLIEFRNRAHGLNRSSAGSSPFDPSPCNHVGFSKVFIHRTKLKFLVKAAICRSAVRMKYRVACRMYGLFGVRI